MISPAQIRAARALIGWSQSDVIRAVNLTPAALSRLENGQVKGRAGTLQRLEEMFVSAGVEFLGDDGVRLKQKSVSIVQYDGRDAVRQMQDDIYTTMLCAAPPREMLLNGLDERKFLKASAADLKKQRERLQAGGIRQKILVRERDRFFVMPPEVATYRWIAPELFGLIPSIVYGDKVAIIFWGPPVQVITMESPALADTYRKQFTALWRTAKPVPFTPKELREICQENFG